MKIDIKKRLKNKTFLISASVLIVSFIYSLLSLFDVIPHISQKEITDVIAMGVNILAFLGVLVDPTTEGIGDKPSEEVIIKSDDFQTEFQNENSAEAENEKVKIYSLKEKRENENE